MYFLDKLPKLQPPTTTILRLAELVVMLNHFEFDGYFYNKIRGVAMGTKMGLSYACLFMGYIEEQAPWTVYLEESIFIFSIYRWYCGSGIDVQRWTLYIYRWIQWFPWFDQFHALHLYRFYYVFGWCFLDKQRGRHNCVYHSLQTNWLSCIFAIWFQSPHCVYK